jgi:hypothetical protein
MKMPSRSIPSVLQGSIPGIARNDLHCNFSVTSCLAGIDFDRQATDFILAASKVRCALLTILLIFRGP